jgi:hypothetical protein
MEDTLQIRKIIAENGGAQTIVGDSPRRLVSISPEDIATTDPITAADVQRRCYKA